MSVCLHAYLPSHLFLAVFSSNLHDCSAWCTFAETFFSFSFLLFFSNFCSKAKHIRHCSVWCTVFTDFLKLPVTSKTEHVRQYSAWCTSVLSVFDLVTFTSKAEHSTHNLAHDTAQEYSSNVLELTVTGKSEHNTHYNTGCIYVLRVFLSLTGTSKAVT